MIRCVYTESDKVRSNFRRYLHIIDNKSCTKEKNVLELRKLIVARPINIGENPISVFSTTKGQYSENVYDL